jgi:signal transduction histidine kinase
MRNDITILQDGERRDYDVDVSPVYDSHEQYLGRVVLISDVTDQRRSQRQLEAKTQALERRNEKLDQFASIVAHDLRNPIAVAKGHLEIARADGSEESFEHVEDALGRMEAITEDVLELARQERELSEVEPVDLAALSERAWETVETGDATLELETDGRVVADANRLRQVLENLFRNAVEHGSTSPHSSSHEDAVEHGPKGVAVRVGDLPGGFYVEDDGSGIPDHVRDQVFESGFTTDEEGTGLGLSIVIAAAEAHGWSVEITRSDEGGARFEFLGVERETSDEPQVGEGEFVFGTSE